MPTRPANQSQPDQGLSLDADNVEQQEPAAEQAAEFVETTTVSKTPICPDCSKPGRPVLMVSYTTKPPFTYYRCPNYKSKKCRRRNKVLQPKMSKALLRNGRRQSPGDLADR